MAIIRSKKPTDAVLQDECDEEALRCAELHNKYQATVESWRVPKGLSPFVRTALKQADQSTPMAMHRFVGRPGMFLSVLVMVSLIGSYAAGFGYILNVHYGGECTEDNGCQSCFVSLEESDASTTTCTALSVSTLDVASGCLSFSMDNSYDKVDSIFEYMKQYDESNTLLTMEGDPEDDDSPGVPEGARQDITTRFAKQSEIWKCFDKNSRGQVIDPSAYCILQWASGVTDGAFGLTNPNGAWMGRSDSFALFDADLSDVQSTVESFTDEEKQSAIDMAIKVLYSSISTSCLRNSADWTNATTLTLIGENGDLDIDYVEFQGCGCRVQCPGDAGVIGGSSLDVTTSERAASAPSTSFRSAHSRVPRLQCACACPGSATIAARKASSAPSMSFRSPISKMDKL